MASSAEQVESLLQKAYNFQIMGEPQEALKCAEAARQLEPENSNVLLSLAYSFAGLKNGEKTRFYAEAALKADPENSRVQYFFGTDALEKREYDKAIEFYKKALLSSPWDSDFTYALARAYVHKARTYERQKNFDEAINCYKLILELSPNDPNIYFWMALSCELNSDRKGMLEYYKKSMDRFPNENRVQIIKHILAGVSNLEKQEFPPSLLSEDPSMRISQKYLWTLLEKNDFDSVEKTFQDLLRKKQTSEGLSLLKLAYSRFGQQPMSSVRSGEFNEKINFLLNEWLKAKPSSHFANACMGKWLLNFAWEARGGGWGASVPSEAWKVFKKRLEAAEVFLNKAYESEPSDPFVPAWLISISMGLGNDRKEMEKQFERAIKADRNEAEAYISKLTFLMPKWGGSVSEMLEFARECAKDEHPGTYIPFMLVLAHRELFDRSEDTEYFKQPGVWAEVKTVFDTLLKEFPKNNSFHNHFAFVAFHADDLETARKEFEIIKDDWDPDCWRNDYKNFQKVRDIVLNGKEEKK